MSRNILAADPKVAAYHRGEAPVPPKSLLWPLYGAGLENLGVDDKPISVATPKPGPEQLLVRHDAVGLCFSDTKVIKAGETHPRLLGRDMKADPVVLGHEVALTVIEVGQNLTGQYRRGDRFVVQADVYYKGKGLAYGYVLQGGLSQYNLVGEEILHGDEGCYLLPVKPETGYAQAALTEPWACITASYDVPYRVGWKREGTVVIAAGPAATGEYTLGVPYAGGPPPACVVTVGVRGPLLDELKQRARTDGFTLIELGAANAETLASAQAATPQGAFDDIVLLGADAALYELLEPAAAKGALLNLVGARGFQGAAQVDVGRIHYDQLYVTGTVEPVIAAGYAPVRTELVPGGRTAFLGAAGPMGQMHVQRALQMPQGPKLMVATDLIAERLDVLKVKFSQFIEAKRGVTELVCTTPGAKSAAEFNASLVQLTGGSGFDDVVVLVPSPGLIAGALALAAPHCVLNLFAGINRGVKAALDLRLVVNKGIRFTGTSGSAIRDMRSMLFAAESGAIDPNLSVAAVSGLGDAKKGLEGVVHQTFTGKVVIYPQIVDFPLTTLEDLGKAWPKVYAKLGPHASWTVEAEAQFLKDLLP